MDDRLAEYSRKIMTKCRLEEEQSEASKLACQQGEMLVRSDTQGV
jgi:hypothetical protein